MQAEIIVVGNGKLAKAILAFSEENNLPNKIYPYNILHWKDNFRKTNNLLPKIIIHVGSGRQYSETLEYANENKCIYIQAATKKRIEMKIPEKLSFVFINAPNLSILMVKTIYLTKILGKLFLNSKKELLESHQAAKESVSGTAVKMAKYLGIKEENIRKIRNIRIQSEELKIANIERHAYHRIKIFEAEDNIEIVTRIEGLRSYVTGLFHISHASLTLDVGTYEIEDLIENEIL